MGLHIFGIRHHGPGCARSLKAALDELRPDAIVLEGPSDVEPVLPLLTHGEMVPPVALLIYPPDEPKRAVYYPLAVFSPEWQAIGWAQQQGAALRLMDLPQYHRLAIDLEEEKRAKHEGNGSPQSQPEQPLDEASEGQGEAKEQGGPAAETNGSPSDVRTDPIAVLAEAAGYKDHELWWEEQIERRRDATGLFEAILDAMRAVREHAPETIERDLLREAYMRTTLRAAQKEGFQRIAVICGAWHAPVLDEKALDGDVPGCTKKDDAARLKGLPKIKTEATWIPWTYSRLTYRSGYGAGVHSPGWYAHLWHAHDKAAMRWVATAARLLRKADLDASSASVIEAVRLADALAAMRELRAPGLAELNEAILTVLCHGEPSPLRLIRDKLEIGDELGRVPTDAPSVPLARDLEQQQRSLRMKPSSEIKTLDFDLRSATDLARSHLLHRLNLLGIAWGAVQRAGSRSSTFHEIWRVQWQPEFAVALIEANIWGNSVATAAAMKVVHQARESQDLAAITALLDSAILAGLTTAVDPLIDRIQELSAGAADVRQLLDSLLPLARVARYGDVRGTRAEHLTPVIVGMFERASVGLLAACSSLDDDAAERMLASIAQAQQAIDLLNDAELQAEWRERLGQLVHSSVHGLLRGWACRLLVEQHVIDDEESYRLTRLALSTADDAAKAAAWITGLLRGSGLVVLHHDALWQVLDAWLCDLAPDMFTQLLPLLRRAFSGFAGPERRQMGEKVKRLDRASAGQGGRKAVPVSSDINHDRARLVLPVLAHILGVKIDGQI